jgi:hypothetical protein
MASVTITNISTGMTLGTTFAAYGLYDTRPGSMFYAGGTSLVTCTLAIAGSTISGSTTSTPDSTGLSGYWMSSFSGVPTGTGGVLTAHLNVPSPPPDAQASNLTVSVPAGPGPIVGINPPPPPPPPPPPMKEDKSKDPPDGAVAAAVKHKVKKKFKIGGTYTSGPSDIVLVSIRKGGKPCGQSTIHTLNPGAKTWEDDVEANLGELGDGYAIIAELQHNAQRKATAAILGVTIEN